MGNSFLSTIGLLGVVILCTIAVAMVRETGLFRDIEASLAVKFDQLEVASPLDNDLLPTATFDKNEINETREEMDTRKNSQRQEPREDNPEYREENKEQKNHLSKNEMENDIQNNSSNSTNDRTVERSTDNGAKQQDVIRLAMNATGTTKNTSSETESTPVDSKLCWLISFPNSGTTYTLINTEIISQRATVSNYAFEMHYGNPIPVRNTSDDLSDGPWWRNHRLPMPPVALTKTHCTGYSDRVPLQDSIISPETFLEGCTRSLQYMSPADVAIQNETVRFYKHKDLVASVIHLIRNPFDNIVSRMHHHWKLHLSDEQYRKVSQSREEGFMTWCNINDAAFWKEQEVPKNITNTIDLNLIPFDADLLLKVPCHSEFFRYTQWHNAAIRMIEQEHIPSLLIYYEDYETNYNQTVDSILRFLGMSRKAPPLPFTTGKTYSDIFFPGQMQNTTKQLLKAMASNELWSILTRYFPSS